MSQTEKAVNAVSGKTARACDSCLQRRARWYCAADDAFLCQSCDTSVHSANPLARRHDRVHLKTSSSSSLSLLPSSDLNSAVPAWHQGFKRKARTPRHAKASPTVSKPVPLVPDLEAVADDNNICSNINEVEVEEEEDQLLYQVPIFDPDLAEFCAPPAFYDPYTSVEEMKPAMTNSHLQAAKNQSHGFAGFDHSDMELAEFAADVENLLGNGLDDSFFCIDGLGLLEVREDDGRSQVKMELKDSIGSNENFLVDMEMEFPRKSLEFNFDCGSPMAGEEVEERKVEMVEERNRGTKIGLRLDYEEVIDTWSCRGCSPWTDGERPRFNLDDSWLDFMGTWGTIVGVQVGNGDGGREARVSRYREKRRTRLFSKKIRYEVRKLNAEKRPRMKGRFVKRSLFPAAAADSATFPYA